MSSFLKFFIGINVVNIVKEEDKVLVQAKPFNTNETLDDFYAVPPDNVEGQDLDYRALVEAMRTVDTTPEYAHLPRVDPGDMKPLMPEKSHLYFAFFKKFHRKDYSKISAYESDIREKIFKDSISKIIKLTELVPSANFNINEFADLTLEEFHSYYTGFNASGLNNTDAKLYTPTLLPPEELDWSAADVHFSARHQRICKSSYIFSAVANIELQVMRSLQKSPYYSILQPYDCEPTGDCNRGGLPHLILQTIQSMGGIALENSFHDSDREYVMRIKHPCEKWKPVARLMNVAEVIRFKVLSESDLVAAVYEYGAVTTAIYVSEAIKNYQSGILTGLDCHKPPNHAVVIVGYGVKDNIPYWIILNSWGHDWGERGYFFLRRGFHDCGIGEYLVTVRIQPITIPKKLVLAPENHVTYHDLPAITVSHYTEPTFQSDNPATVVASRWSTRPWGTFSVPLGPPVSFRRHLQPLFYEQAFDRIVKGLDKSSSSTIDTKDDNSKEILRNITFKSNLINLNLGKFRSKMIAIHQTTDSASKSKERKPTSMKSTLAIFTTTSKPLDTQINSDSTSSFNYITKEIQTLKPKTKTFSTNFHRKHKHIKQSITEYLLMRKLKLSTYTELYKLLASTPTSSISTKLPIFVSDVFSSSEENSRDAQLIQSSTSSLISTPHLSTPNQTLSISKKSILKYSIFVKTLDTSSDEKNKESADAT